MNIHYTNGQIYKNLMTLRNLMEPVSCWRGDVQKQKPSRHLEVFAYSESN